METGNFELPLIERTDSSKHRHMAASQARHKMVLSFLISDILAILLAVGMSSALTFASFGPLPKFSLLWVPAYILVFILSAWTRGLYPANGMSASEQFRNITIATSIIFLTIFSTTFFVKTGDVLLHFLIALSWFFCIIAVTLMRTIVRNILTKINYWGEPAIVVGQKDGATRITSYFERYPKIGLRPEILVTIPCDFDSIPGENMAKLTNRLKLLQKLTRLKTIIIVYDYISEYPIIRDIFRDTFEKIVLINSNEIDVDLGGLSVKQYGNLQAFEVSHTLLNRSAQIQKRLLDIFIAGLGLVLLFPLLAVISFAITLDSPGGVFYRQQRIGRKGKYFKIMKFRTMHPNAEIILQNVLASDSNLKEEWDTFQKLKKDPRITRVGQVLRRLSLDEIPQLVNVLIGEMSIVGPRPLMIDQKELYGQNFINYIRVTPGITGLWQISGRNHTTFTQRVNFDDEYINNWNIWSDIYIITRTAWVILRRDGAS